MELNSSFLRNRDPRLAVHDLENKVLFLVAGKCE